MINTEIRGMIFIGNHGVICLSEVETHTAFWAVYEEKRCSRSTLAVENSEKRMPYFLGVSEQRRQSVQKRRRHW